AGMVKAQKDADSQLEVLATNETGRLAKQERAISTYVQALEQQQRALELAGQRAVLGVGQGDRQNALSGELNSQQDRFAQQSLELANQKSDPSRNMSEEEFKRKSQALADANKAATDQIRQNYADVENAQGDWTKGATAAWDNYLDSARNVAGQTKSLFGNAFSSMEDAVVNFATTGKFSFADFTKSVLADMARIATRQASSALLSSLVGSAASYLGGSAAGGNGLAAGSAGAASSNLGASAGGYSGSYFPQALGGAWSGGVQMFADGGAFTNTIVSKPTAFGMANGKTGIAGEAGPEAIMPLTRTSSGKLGVMAMGGGGAGATQINVEVHIDGDGNASSSADAPGYDLFGKELAAFVEQKYQQLRNKDMGQGGVINKAIKGR
ncbi:phage tail tape measure protein, partial [Pseudomonas edaphica]